MDNELCWKMRAVDWICTDKDPAALEILEGRIQEKGQPTNDYVLRIGCPRRLSSETARRIALRPTTGLVSTAALLGSFLVLSQRVAIVFTVWQELWS